MHTDSNDPELLSEFNEIGWQEFYIRVAELMKINTSIKGIYGGSWFFDPDLEEISPRLSYLRKIPIENGGRFFYTGSNEHDIKLSTLKSKTRKKLYQEGKYLPKSYLLIWSRTKLLAWADKKVTE